MKKKKCLRQPSLAVFPFPPFESPIPLLSCIPCRLLRSALLAPASDQVAAPSHDRNLRALSKSISSSLLFGHVRAAGPGASVHQYNCHPFNKGRYMFMHNGDISRFSKIRRGLLGKLRDELFENISGTTDSELLFHLILNELPDWHTPQDPATLQAAVTTAMSQVIQANRGQPNSLNIAFTDGETVIATRYRNSESEEPPSLYFHMGPMPGEKAWDLDKLGGFDTMETNPNVHDNKGAARRAVDVADYLRSGSTHGVRKCKASTQSKFVATQALLVSSEPLSTHGLDNWQLCPVNSMIVAAPTRPMAGRCTRGTLVAALRNGSHSSGRRNTTNLSPSGTPVLEIEVKCMRDLCQTALRELEAEGHGPVRSASDRDMVMHETKAGQRTSELQESRLKPSFSPGEAQHHHRWFSQESGMELVELSSSLPVGYLQSRLHHAASADAKTIHAMQSAGNGSGEHATPGKTVPGFSVVANPVVGNVSSEPVIGFKVSDGHAPSLDTGTYRMLELRAETTSTTSDGELKASQWPGEESGTAGGEYHRVVNEEGDDFISPSATSRPVRMNMKRNKSIGQNLAAGSWQG